VTEAKMFGSECLKVGAKVFAVDYKGELVLKLPRQRVEREIAAGEGAPFTLMAGRVMKEWVQIAPSPLAGARGRGAAIRLERLRPPLFGGAPHPARRRSMERAHPRRASARGRGRGGAARPRGVGLARPRPGLAPHPRCGRRRRLDLVGRRRLRP
jgi:hypothetical protein